MLFPLFHMQCLRNAALDCESDVWDSTSSLWADRLPDERFVDATPVVWPDSDDDSCPPTPHCVSATAKTSLSRLPDEPSTDNGPTVSPEEEEEKEEKEEGKEEVKEEE